MFPLTKESAMDDRSALLPADPFSVRQQAHRLVKA
jgi:hypothetical protein